MTHWLNMKVVSMTERIEGMTNNITDSSLTVKGNIIKFKDLWKHYPSDRLVHKINKDGHDFSNHCAINVSHSLYKNGILLKAFNGTKCWGCPTPDKRGKGIHAIRAQELADYLKKQPFAGCPKPESLDTKNFYDKINNKTGIIFFQNYWTRSSDSGENRTGDHIDLWDGNELASIGWVASTIRYYFPVFSEENLDMSDFSKSSKILFWKIE